MTDKKAIYSLGNAPEWLFVVKNWREELGWRPFYWITVARNHDSVGKEYPSVHRHDFVDLNRCIPCQAYADRLWRGLDSDVLKEFSEVEQTAIEMMDRMDLGGTFTFSERQRTYLWHLSYWLMIISEEHPEVVVFNAPPHSPGEYVLHEVCRRRNVNVRVFLPTQLCSLHMVGDSYDCIPPELTDRYARRLAENDLRLGHDMQEALDVLRSTAGTDPWYVTNAREREMKKARLRSKIEKALAEGQIGTIPLNLDPDKQVDVLSRSKNAPINEANSIKIRRVYKRPDQDLGAETLSKEEYQTYLKWAYVEKIKLDSTYRRLETEVDLTTPYVFLALHYQPERTTCPDGERFNNQFLAAALLANAMPEGWRLYVKEHPSQFTYHNNGEQSRRPEFYSDLLSLPNTQLVSTDMPSHDLVKNARAVATVTGFVGWEALMKEIPVIVFGAAWYRACRGVYEVHKQADAKRALDMIATGEKHKLDEIVAFAGALEDAGTVCYSNTSLSSAVEIEPDELVAALTSAMLRFERYTDCSEEEAPTGELSVFQH